MRWADRAACRTVSHAVMFPKGTGTASYTAAKAICATCPVTGECLTYALNTSQTHGCWGGLDPTEREELTEAAS